MKLLRIAAVATVAMALFGPTAERAAAQAAAEPVVEQIVKRGALRVGLATFTPWAMRSKTGSLIGFEVDVANELAKDMGVKLELVPTAWDGIIPALIAGRFDTIIGGMSITPQRNMTVNFTIPYAYAGTGIVANKKVPETSKLEDFNAARLTVACRRATTACFAAQRMFPKATMRQFDDEAQVTQEVLNGNAHFALSSEPKPTFWALDNPDKLWLPTKGEPLDKLAAAFAVRKGDHDSLNFFNNWITLKTDSGWLQERHAYWFKTRDWLTEAAPGQ